MRERPILFSAPMVRAILDGRKTQTRRVIKPRPVDVVTFLARDNRPTGEYGLCFHPRVVSKHIQCPYGVPGDRLWVREVWQHAPQKYCHCPQPSLAVPCDDWQEGTGCRSNRGDVVYRAEGGKAPCWRSSIHMPRWASRILLEVTDVRVQRVQEISADDARAEGMPVRPYGPASDFAAIDQFALLWTKINGKRGYGWDENPWVWTITFKIIEARRAA